MGLVFVAAAGPLVSGALKLLALGTQDLPVHLLVLSRPVLQPMGECTPSWLKVRILLQALEMMGAAAPGAVHTPSVWYLLVRHIIY